MYVRHRNVSETVMTIRRVTGEAEMNADWQEEVLSRGSVPNVPNAIEGVALAEEEVEEEGDYEDVEDVLVKEAENVERFEDHVEGRNEETDAGVENGMEEGFYRGLGYSEDVGAAFDGVPNTFLEGLQGIDFADKTFKPPREYDERFEGLLA